MEKYTFKQKINGKNLNLCFVLQILSKILKLNTRFFVCFFLTFNQTSKYMTVCLYVLEILFSKNYKFEQYILFFFILSSISFKYQIKIQNKKNEKKFCPVLQSFPCARSFIYFVCMKACNFCVFFVGIVCNHRVYINAYKLVFVWISTNLH